MTQATGNSDPRVVAAIDKAIGLANSGAVGLAVEALTNILPDFPEAGAVRAYLAWYLQELGRQDEAIEQSGIAVNLSPKSEMGSLTRFHILWKAGRHIDALDEMKRFLNIRPSEQYLAMIKDWEPGN